MRNIKILLLALVLVSLTFSAKILDLEEITQDYNQWCWAGCSYTILTFYGETVTQPIIVQYAYGDSTINQWNWLSGHYDVEYQGKIYNPHGINEILDHWNTPNQSGYYYLSETEWKKEVNDSHPFVIRWGWSNGNGGHFVVGQGYLDNGNYQIMDPWYGCGYTINTYQWMKSAKGQGNWTHTLTTDRSVIQTKYTLTVNNGKGGGNFTSGTNTVIVANLPQDGYAFDKWTGDISYLNDIMNDTVTVTMPSKNITVTATYIDTSTPIDTTNPSKNLLFIAGWEDTKDSYGSSLNMDTSKKDSDTIISGAYTIASSDTASEEWPWASISAYTGNDLEFVTAVKVVYKSSNPIKLVLEEPILSDSGVAFYKELSAQTDFETVYIPINAFKQPKWASGDLEYDSPNLKKINSISFTSDLYGKSTSIEIKELILFNYKGDPVSLINKSKIGLPVNIFLKNNNIMIKLQETGAFNLSLYSLSGKKIYETEFKSKGTLNSIPVDRFGKQTLIMKIKGKDTLYKGLISLAK